MFLGTMKNQTRIHIGFAIIQTVADGGAIIADTGIQLDANVQWN